MSARLLDGRRLAEEILAAARQASRRAARRRGRAPRLAIVAAQSPEARNYLKAKLRACARAGLDASVHLLSPGPRAKTLGLLADVAADPAIDAVIVETPYPEGLVAADVADAIPPAKDAEGITAGSYGRLFLAKSWDQAGGLLGPCTAVAVARLALAAGLPLAGRRAVVIGRSATVGRPAAHLLSTLDLTVTLAHSRTRGLPALCREADVLVAAAGRAGLVKAAWVKRGALVIDAGVNAVPGGVAGDVAAGAAARAKIITPVPGGVGPVTTAVAVLQAARLAESTPVTGRRR